MSDSLSIDVDLQLTQDFLDPADWQTPSVWADLHARLLRGDVPGGEYLGWLHWPSRILGDFDHVAGVSASSSASSSTPSSRPSSTPSSRLAGTSTMASARAATTSVLSSVLEAAEEIRQSADALVVIGIGGSYLGARAAFDWCKSTYYNALPAAERGGPELYFAGNHLSETELRDLLHVLAGKRVAVNVISKSGGTTEPAVAFRVLREWLVEQVGPAEARKRIYATTDQAKGALKQLADREGYRTFVIPDDIGGRFSVLTPVGLLPLAAVGVDVVALLTGAAEMEAALTQPDATGKDLADNPAYRYAAVRNALYRKGKTTEVLACYEPGLRSFAEWWKQLFGESEGKDGKGIFPSSLGFTTDLHSLGQFVQDGTRNLFETVVWVGDTDAGQRVPHSEDVEDGLEYLTGRPIGEINQAACRATQQAHVAGGVPNLTLTVPRRDERTLGNLFYFFEFSCAVSARMLGVNPFNQPGVEAYKGNMFRILGKPGY